MPTRYRTIGVIGGMGPLATLDFERTLLTLSGACKDEEFPAMLVCNESQIPDRAAAILSGGTSPIPALVRSARGLIKAGAEVLCMPCNTAHAFYDAILDGIAECGDIPFVHIVRETVEHVRRLRDVRAVGLLGVTSTLRTRLYQNALEAVNVHVIVPSDKDQDRLVMEAVYGLEGLKAGHTDAPRRRLMQATVNLRDAGAEAVILACTELPMALSRACVPLINPTEILARAVLREATILES